MGAFNPDASLSLSLLLISHLALSPSPPPCASPLPLSSPRVRLVFRRSSDLHHGGKRSCNAVGKGGTRCHGRRRRNAPPTGALFLSFFSPMSFLFFLFFLFLFLSLSRHLHCFILLLAGFAMVHSVSHRRLAVSIRGYLSVTF